VRFVILRLFSKIFSQMPEDCRRIGRTSIKSRDAARAAPAAAALDSNDDVLVEEATLLQKPDRRFRRELIDAKLAHTDEIAQSLGLLGFGKFEKRIQAVNLTARGRLSVLRKRFQLSLDEFAQRTIFKAFDYRASALEGHEEDSFPRNEPADVIDLAEKRGLFNGRTQQSNRTYRGSARIVGRCENGVPDTKPQLNHQILLETGLTTTLAIPLLNVSRTEEVRLGAVVA
jgi:hypothetical protein